MQITERVVGDVTILDLKGRLVVADGDDLFRDTLNRLIDSGCRKVLLNLGELTYVDSGGLGVMVAKYVSMFNRDGQLKLCHVHERPFRVLHITRLLSVFESFDSEAEAVQSFNKR
jgi:anti-sigma B factor antagonist